MVRNKSYKSRTGYRRKMVNPTIVPKRESDLKCDVSIFEYNGAEIESFRLKRSEEIKKLTESSKNIWINVRGLQKTDVEKICALFGIHPLIVEDILSVGQRPKLDEFDTFLFTLLNTLSFDKEEGYIESEQISVILQKKVLITFQESNGTDVFQNVRDRLKIPESRLRNSNADYLFYLLLDVVVDNYFVVMESLGEKIEDLEDVIGGDIRTDTLNQINNLRKEMMFLRRSVSPVREIINTVLRDESALIDDITKRYFKDIYDHIIQINELTESYRDMMINLQDLYLSNVNIKMNEVMKVMAIVTCLLAPATVIGGIFGMNFHKIPFTGSPVGFYLAVFLMLFVPLIMIWIFKKRGWF